MGFWQSGFFGVLGNVLELMSEFLGVCILGYEVLLLDDWVYGVLCVLFCGILAIWAFCKLMVFWGFG